MQKYSLLLLRIRHLHLKIRGIGFSETLSPFSPASMTGYVFDSLAKVMSHVALTAGHRCCCPTRRVSEPPGSVAFSKPSSGPSLSLSCKIQEAEFGVVYLIHKPSWSCPRDAQFASHMTREEGESSEVQRPEKRVTESLFYT